MTEHLFASTTPGLEPALLTECRALDAKAHPVAGGVELSGERGLHRQANLRLRVASRVLLRLARFEAKDPSALRTQLKALDLSPHLRSGERPAVEASTHRTPLPGTLIERVVAERWGSTGPIGATLLVAVDGTQVRVSLDTSGELLYRRGYREEVGHAPLRETLAAGVLSLAGYDPALPLWDPMCGSGTLPIEGAWLALRRAPGLTRAFAFETWPSHDAAAWDRERTAARAAELSALPAPIWATDIHGGALGQARRNARRAGVLERLKVERRDATVAGASPGPRGLVVANLPYGKRVGDAADLPALAAGVGRALRASVPGWRFAMLVGSTHVESSLGLEAERRHPLENGGLPITLLLGVIP